MSTPLEAALRQAGDDLDKAGVTWALIGGFAVSARTDPRFTRDIDVVVAVADDSAAEALIHALLQDGYRLLASLEQDAQGRLATVRLGSPVTSEIDVIVDLLFASSGIETEIAEAAEHLEILPSLTLPVARTGHLIALKLLSRDDETRPRDTADLIHLRQVAEAEDTDLARESIRLITDRGFHRDRDLGQAMDDLSFA